MGYGLEILLLDSAKIEKGFLIKNKVVFFFATHRHIGHIERVKFFKIKLNLKSNTPFYVSYVPMCFKEKLHPAFVGRQV
jgi:hypothetical protein